jgi:hypothetical protein
MLNDANFGLFPDPDVEIAKFIRDLKQKYNWLQTVVVNWGQVKFEDALRYSPGHKHAEAVLAIA